MRRFVAVSVAVSGMALAMLAQPALAQTKVYSFAPSSNTTPGVWFMNDVRMAGTASIVDLTGIGGTLDSGQPLPIGAAKLTTLYDNGDKAEVGVLDSYGKPQDIVATLKLAYSYYKASTPGNAFAAPSIKLTFYNPVCDDPASAGDCFFTLTYEPYWNGSNGPGVVTAPLPNTWTAVVIDSTTGVFWTSGGFGLANGAGGPPFYTLAGVLAAASSDFADSDLVMVSVGVGTYNQGQIGYFDAVKISHSYSAGYSAYYDFEPAGPAYSCDGFEPPMNLAYLPPAMGGGEIGRSVKRNRVLPFKATLLDGDGNPVTALNSPPVIQVTYVPTVGPAADVTADALTSGKRSDGNQFELTGDSWAFNLWTKNYTAVGRYEATMVSGDPGEYVIDPTCRGVFVIEP